MRQSWLEWIIPLCDISVQRLFIRLSLYDHKLFLYQTQIPPIETKFNENICTMKNWLFVLESTGSFYYCVRQDYKVYIQKEKLDK